MRRDDLAVRTWYQASEDVNEYGEETLRIKGVYATEVGDDMPILTRLIRWKIVHKLDVDLGFEFKDASASSRSSVNNCTGRSGAEDASKPGGGLLKDFEDMDKSERRRLLMRIRAGQPVKAVRTHRRPEKIEEALLKSLLKSKF